MSKFKKFSLGEIKGKKVSGYTQDGRSRVMYQGRIVDLKKAAPETLEQMMKQKELPPFLLVEKPQNNT